jgi:alanyl aminopeptidase
MRFIPMCSCLALSCAVLIAAPTGEVPKMRLGNSVLPRHYAVELTLEPGKDTFAGVVDIDIDVRQPQDTIWLNALEITIRDATVGGKAAKTIAGSAQVVGLSTGQLVPAGRTKLHIAYDGHISKKSSAGIFQLQEDNRWYLYTQFEPTDARRAFPCFDEPGFKTPWDIALRVPKDQMAFANSPQAAESDGGNGMKLVRFATSRPLPSYLVAVAVGPFEVVDLGRVGRKHTPMRVIVPYGKTGEAKFASESLPQLLQRLEDYFGTPFPYAKLDSIVMPISTFAMENVGLITYSEGLLLAKPDKDTISRQRGSAIVSAHEMAHQWFGDLVTTAWWDDIWLNEAFATWMEGKIVGEWKPEWHIDTTEVNDRLGAMGTDSLVTTRKIRQPILSDNDIANAFDNITYQKGAAVIRMFETWIGAAKFRTGVQLYLKENADGAASVTQFLAAISKGAGKDVSPAFSTFLDQAGVPVLSMQLECGGKQPQVAVSQKRYLPIGSPGSASQNWRIPICVKYDADGHIRNQCELLADPRTTLKLEGAKACPAWVMGNDGANGYYRVAYQPATLQRLLSAGVERLTLPEKIGLLGDVNSLVASGDIQEADALALVAKFGNAPEREIVSATMGIAGAAVGRTVPDDLLPKGRKFIRDVYGDRATRLGWKSTPGESEDTRLLRQSLVPFTVSGGRVEPLIEQARELARAWLKDHAAVEPAMQGSVLSMAAQFGNRAYFDALVAALSAEKDRRSRQSIIGALGSFANPELARAAMQLFLTGNYDAREAGFALLFGPLKYRETRTLPFEFVQQNLDAILTKLPREVGEDFAAFLPAVGGGFCDASGRRQVEEFFKDRVQSYSGGPRQLAQVLESIDICTALTKVTGPSIEEFLRKY